MKTWSSKNRSRYRFRGRRSRRPWLTAVIALTWASAWPALGQTSSIGRRHQAQTPAEPPPSRETTPAKGNPVLERYSLIAVKAKAPKTFKVEDHITIIVRQQRKFESDADLKSKRKYDVASQLEAFFKPIDGGLGATTFARGKPNVDYNFQQEQKNQADASREDKLTTRLTGTILDVKPNGNLVIWARASTHHEDDVSIMTLTGVVAKDRVSADGSVLSTDIADLAIDIQNKGSVRDGSKRGWLAAMVDKVRPF